MTVQIAQNIPLHATKIFLKKGDCRLLQSAGFRCLSFFVLGQLHGFKQPMTISNTSLQGTLQLHLSQRANTSRWYDTLYSTRFRWCRRHHWAVPYLCNHQTWRSQLIITKHCGQGVISSHYWELHISVPAQMPNSTAITIYRSTLTMFILHCGPQSAGAFARVSWDNRQKESWILRFLLNFIPVGWWNCCSDLRSFYCILEPHQGHSANIIAWRGYIWYIVAFIRISYAVIHSTSCIRDSRLWMLIPQFFTHFEPFCRTRYVCLMKVCCVLMNMS